MNDTAHFRLFNIGCRLFGLMSLVAGAGFLFSAAAYLLSPQMTEGVNTVSGSAAIDAFAVGVFSSIIGFFTIRAEAHRPDIPTGEKRNAKHRSWWTGDVI